MCDCYTAKCEMCGCDIQMHIADYCTERENVHPYCHRCTKKLIKAGIPKVAQTFCELIGRTGEYGQIKGGRKGQEVIILCDDPKAYGIHLN